jgi:glycerate kinase
MPSAASFRGGAVIGRVVLAPNAYKGSLGAAAVAEAMAEGIARTTLPVECVVRPMADGGDGSIDAVVTAGFSRVPVTVRGPTGASVAASLAMRGDVAVVELAGTCGMARLSGGSLAPMTSSTLGLGDALRAALDHGAREVIVCLGGSASTDGGAGLLTALGARLLDRRGRPVEPMGRTLDEVADLDLAALHPRLGETTWRLVSLPGHACSPAPRVVTWPRSPAPAPRAGRPPPCSPLWLPASDPGRS